jgi:hypothetical protein
MVLDAADVLAGGGEEGAGVLHALVAGRHLFQTPERQQRFVVDGHYHLHGVNGKNLFTLETNPPRFAA